MTFNRTKLKKVAGSLAMLLMVLMLSIQSVSADNGSYVPSDVTAMEACPESGVWPAGCTPGNSGGGTSSNACPESGVWPPGCTPGGSGGAPAPAPGNACPATGVWPPGCTPGGSGGAPAPAPAPAPGNACPESGAWPPGCTPSGTPAPTPEPPAEEGPAVEEAIGVITLVYASDPEEVLGVFPIFEFNAESLTIRMIFNEITLQEMRSNLDGALAGDQASCDRYEEAYEVMKATGGFYVDVPAEWQGVHDAYLSAFIFGLDRTRPAYLACLNDGQVNQFNYGLAFTAIEDALRVLTPALDQAIAML